MGFGSLATYVILFTVGLSMAVGVMSTVRDYFSQSSTSIEVRQEISRFQSGSTMEIINSTFDERGQNRSLLWDENEEFEEGIFEDTETDDDSVVIVDGEAEGTWFSEIVELKGPANFTFLSADGSEPLIEEPIEIRLRTAETRDEMTGDFIGPDGTDGGDDFYLAHEEDQEIYEGHMNDSFIQARVDFEEDFVDDPELNFLEIDYHYLGILEFLIRNTGSFELDEDRLDYFVAGQRIPRDSVLDKEVIDVPGLPNPGVWDSEKDLLVKLPVGLIEGTTLLTLTNEHATRESKRLEI